MLNPGLNTRVFQGGSLRRDFPHVATVFENTFATTSIMVDDLVEMQLSCDNKTARAMILNNSVELNRKSSCDETGSIVAGVQRSSVVGVA